MTRLTLRRMQERPVTGTVPPALDQSPGTPGAPTMASRVVKQFRVYSIFGNKATEQLVPLRSLVRGVMRTSAAYDASPCLPGACSVLFHCALQPATAGLRTRNKVILHVVRSLGSGSIAITSFNGSLTVPMSRKGSHGLKRETAHTCSHGCHRGTNRCAHTCCSSPVSPFPCANPA